MMTSYLTKIGKKIKTMTLMCMRVAWDLLVESSVEIQILEGHH
jgi:hypothetical protein